MSLAGARYLVTGGTGSFGHFIVERLLSEGAAEVRVLSRDEKKQHDMRVHYGTRSDLTLLIGDIRDNDTVDEAMRGIDVVFQAAALKQVPSCERFPMEAVRTNVNGAENVVHAALRHDVSAFVAISTDKAVKPVNAMGMSKALQEKITLRASESRLNRNTRCSVVRYGNVLRSRGSIVPLFRRQLARGERLTVTDERMTRFLLTLDDAIDLVLYAAEHAASGETLVRKAPACRIVDLAEVLSDEAGRPLEYDTIGILPGEKLHEILISEEEIHRVEESVDDYYKINPWWSSPKSNGIDAEFRSSDQLIDKDEIKALIARADAEFERMGITGGEFAKF
ncbi:MAG TPA: SDR family NAD(P)-dependent oxidoreductase [Plantibacter sp.]|uniref:SDR family NAD(P)-dependent oxidoreductase n=1 Tax=Plantibacter sp. TaxID=1871045 RepID=UPI002B807E39|nr:SDR family NAD(P)-dependent oxidoreductase [Plantibacter sp.]